MDAAIPFICRDEIEHQARLNQIAIIAKTKWKDQEISYAIALEGNHDGIVHLNLQQAIVKALRAVRRKISNLSDHIDHHPEITVPILNEFAGEINETLSTLSKLTDKMVQVEAVTDGPPGQQQAEERRRA
jgi:hypothetical protein